MRDKLDLTKVLRLNLIGAAVLFILGVLAVVLMNNTGYQVVVNYWTANSLASQTNTVFAIASHVLFSFQMRWALALLMLLSIVVPIVYVCLIARKKKEIDFEKYKTIDWAITGALMIVLIAVLAGVQDITALLLLVALVVVGYVFKWLGSHYKDVEKKAYIAATICASVPWLVIAIYAISTLVYGSIRSPWYVYVIYLVGLTRLLIMLTGYYGRQPGAKELSSTNKWVYSTSANMIFKAAFAVVLIIGLAK